MGEKGSAETVDMLFPCLGFIPNTDILKEEMSEILDEKGYLKMNYFLQLEGFHHIFAVVDITPFDVEKLAQNAEAHADIVANNIIALEKGQKLKKYSPSDRITLISLGPKRCLM